MADQLAFNDQETCVTYNMLKLTRQLFAWQPRAKLFDYYERAFYNSILGSQEPSNGTKLYHLSLKPGGYKLFGDLEDSLWCCFGTGVENFAKLGDSTYFTSADGSTVWVNLFIASRMTLPTRGVTLVQETTFPDTGETALRIEGEQPATFALRVRMPAWADGVTFAINDSQFAPAQRGEDGYLEVSRQWSPGDRLRVRLPMKLRIERMPDDENLLAFMHGPIALAGQLSEPLTTEQCTVPHRFPFQELRYELGSVPTPAVVAANDARLLRSVRSIDDEPLAFRLPTTNGEVTLRPLGRTIDRHYTVYWRRLAPGTPDLVRFQQRWKLDRALDERTVDRVDVSEFPSEVVHELKSERSRNGRAGQEGYRDAAAGGWFSYRVRVDGATQNTLVGSYWGDERVPRQFEVLVDDEVIATQKLAPGEGVVIDVLHRIPRERTDGKESVVVKFRGVGESLVGGVWGGRVVRE